jgi:hypothetical protein
MKFLKVKIVEYVSHDFPGFVLCTFEDAYGKTWEITEKVPVLTSWDLQEEELPVDGFYIPGEVISEDGDIVNFDTLRPYFISANDGETSFYVKKYQLSDKHSDE